MTFHAISTSTDDDPKGINFSMSRLVATFDNAALEISSNISNLYPNSFNYLSCKAKKKKIKHLSRQIMDETK